MELYYICVICFVRWRDKSSEESVRAEQALEESRDLKNQLEKQKVLIEFR